jgi:hypothetical protein
VRRNRWDISSVPTGRHFSAQAKRSAGLGDQGKDDKKPCRGDTYLDVKDKRRIRMSPFISPIQGWVLDAEQTLACAALCQG